MSNSNAPVIKKEISAVQTPIHFGDEAPKRVHVATLLWVVLGVVLSAGILGLSLRGMWRESTYWDAMQTCEAKGPGYPVKEPGSDNFYIKPNGTYDRYGLLRINRHREEIAAIVGLCDTDSAFAHKLFIKALREGNPSARMVALYCANFLARAQERPYPAREKGVLDASDFELIAEQMNYAQRNEVKSNSAEAIDVRKAALSAFSDLIVITNPQALADFDKSKDAPPYSTVSPAMEEAAKAAFSDEISKDEQPIKEDRDKSKEIKIALRKAAFNGKPVLLIRWSSPTLAHEWWKAHGKDGKWDGDVQRFVIP